VRTWHIKDVSRLYEQTNDTVEVDLRKLWAIKAYMMAVQKDELCCGTAVCFRVSGQGVR
jgi:hypothetical protein